MAEQQQGWVPSHFLSRSLGALTVIAAAALVYFAIPDPAESQINGRVIGPPKFPSSSSSTVHTAQVTDVKRPQQVEMPAPPPIKIFPGLEEPLVATGPVTDAEGKDLDAALKEFHDLPLSLGKDADYSDYGKPLMNFVDTHRGSNWNPALLLNLGLGYYHAGYYSKAFAAFQQSWELGRNAATPQAHMMVDRAVGELAEMHARVGHAEELEALFKDIGNRPIGGPATALLQGAREGLSDFHNRPDISYLCGPQALKNVLIALKASKKQIQVADAARSGRHGFTLTQLSALADKAKLKYKLIYRKAGQPIPVPSVINWNVHHYAAITGIQDGRYVIEDPTFGDRGGDALTAKAIDAEGSGYFLVPINVAEVNKDSGWRIVSPKSDEAKAVFGMGDITQIGTGMNMCPGDKHRVGTHNTPTTNASNCAPATKSGMTAASAMPINISLHLDDRPVGYAPQIGIPNLDQISYNSQEDYQPATFGFSNLSSKWTHGWQAYVGDDPTGTRHAERIAAGGGGYNFPVSAYNSTTHSWTPETPDNSQLFVFFTGSAVDHYERHLPDGSVEYYRKNNGATTFPRIWFLTSVADPQNNATTINYSSTCSSSSCTITSVTDAMGRSTTFTYGLSGYPLLITKITDPFGRYASFTYDTSQRLSTITDPIGITSSFTYSTTETTFVTQLTTPYGNSTFSDTPNPNDPTEVATRSLTLTDPLGYVDYYYFYQKNSSPYPTNPTSPSGTVPTGMGTLNNYLQWRNTYYWNRHAFAACEADPTTPCSISAGVPQKENFTYAALTHWLHEPGTAVMDRGIESVKPALENRTWLNYEGQTSPDWNYNGTLDLPIATGRVLDDGTSQVSKATYNANGLPLTLTDPLGRVTQFTYASNNIDLLTVQQLTAPSTYTTIATYGSYNTQHEPQTYTGPDGQTWNYAYNTVGQLHTVTDPNSDVTTYNYDSTGRLSTIVNANSDTILTLTYDSADRVYQRTDSEGYTLTYAYDNLDRVTQITYPDGTTDQYDYTFQSGPLMGDPSLELRKYTDRLGRVTTYSYDADQRLTSVTEPTSGTSTRTTQYDYYEDGTLKDIIDANSNDTHWDIDIESRPIDKIYAYGTSSAQTETYTYETATSRLKSITDALGQVKTFSYDEANEITGLTYTSTVNTTPNVTFTWDTYFPRLSSMTDGTGTTNYSYTAIGTNGGLKLSSIAGPYSNDTVGLTYDAIGRLSGRNITGGNETFGYDSINRLNSHGTPLGSFTIGYLGQTRQITSQSVTNGSTTISTSWGYDTNTNDRRLISITNSGTTRSYTLSYTSGSATNPYDIQSITDTAASGHPWSTQTRSYTYDLIDRLLTESVTTPGNSTFAYDNLDNPTTWNTPASGSLSPTFNGLNQISTWGSSSYSYDADGDTLSGDGTRTYKWDAENRLIEVDYVGTSNKSVFTYNGIGQRISDAETVSGTTTTTYYEWCGSSICQTRNSSQTAIRRDLPEGEYNVSSGQMLVYMPDQLGSVRDVLDASTGNLVESYDYTPYGAVARSNGSTPTDYQFAGLFAHPASGLNLSATRAQDGVTGRWLNRDPIREIGSINLYAYVKANPIMGIDPMGLCGDNADNCRPLWKAFLFGCHGSWGAVQPLAIFGGTIAIGKALQTILAVPVVGDFFGDEFGGAPKKLQPIQNAEGPHTTFQTDPSGNVTKYQNWEPQSNPQNPNPWEPGTRYDGSGESHFNKATQQDVPTPHVHDPATPGGVRSPNPNEVPTK
jgi:RHS repeat-associated protein